MSVARRRWTPDEKRAVLQLQKEGWTQKQIAEKLRPGVKSAFRSVGDIIREDRKQKEQQAVAPTATSPVSSQTPSQPTSLLPGRSTTSIQLPDTMVGSLTAKEFMTMMDDDQKKIFISTYEGLRGDADEEALTRAENEMLIRAAFSNVKYLRAQSLLHISETYLLADMEGGLTDSDEDKAKRRFAGRGDAYKKEAEQWHKEYMELLNDLKLTRKQRLDKIKDTRNTFLDLQQELATKLRQESLVEEIKRINRATDEEFRRMAQGDVGPDGQRHPWLIGAFDEYLEHPVEDAPPKQLETKENEDAQMGDQPTE